MTYQETRLIKKTKVIHSSGEVIEIYQPQYKKIYSKIVLGGPFLFRRVELEKWVNYVHEAYSGIYLDTYFLTEKQAMEFLAGIKKESEFEIVWESE